MRRHFKRTGSSYLMVILVFVFVSAFSALMLSTLNQSIFQTNAYGLQMQCYYLNNQAAKATVAVLLDGDEDHRLLKTMSYPQTAVMPHTDATGTKELGSSTITVSREFRDYYGESRAWAVARITTTIPDTRASRAGKTFTYEGTAMILIENPVIQLYNLDPEEYFK